MTYNNVQNITLLSTVLVLSIVAISIENVYAEENTKFKMADDVESVFTFTFRDGIEVHNFPVFKMGENFVDNKGTSFEVEGIVGDAPHLHKALDEAYKYRLMALTGGSSFEYDYRFFDVDVDFVKNDRSFKTISYYNCEIADYGIVTLRDDQESYLSSKTGFAIIDKIEFNCSGLNQDADKSASLQKTSFDNIIEYGNLDYEFADNVRTYVTFEYDSGVEKIEFPYFELTSGFQEDEDSVPAQFKVESVVGDYPLLYEAIDNSRKVSGITSAFNTDFEALVEFTKDGNVIRALDYRDCRVEAAEITTLTDKEDGFTGKSGFAIVNQIEFECAGLKPINDRYAELREGTPIWKTTFVSNEQPLHEFPTVDNLHAITTFTYAHGQEIIDFPLFEQGDILIRSDPTLTLKGIVGDFPLLYNVVDENLKIQSQSGPNPLLELFQIDVDMMVGNEVVRTFNYRDCHVIDYVIKSQRDKEDGYFKGFALENIFEFECQGYHPNNPVYDAMFNMYEKAKTTSTTDLRNTDQWGPGFYVP